MDTELKKLVFIPQYILNTYSARGKSFNQLVQDIDRIMLDKDINKETALIEYFNKSLSKYDVNDILGSNVIASKYLDLTNSLIIKKDCDYARTITNLVSPDINIKEIIMSSTNNNGVEVPFQFLVSETTVFVVLQIGFCNFISYNVIEFKTWFLNILVNYLIKVCEEKKFLRSQLFHDFNKLVYHSLD